MKKTNDPSNYYAMSHPFEGENKANETLELFYQKVSEARQECNIADVLIVTKDSILYPDGQIGGFMQHSQTGDSTNGVIMAAYVYGKVQAEHRELLNKLAKG